MFTASWLGNWYYKWREKKFESFTMQTHFEVHFTCFVNWHTHIKHIIYKGNVYKLYNDKVHHSAVIFLNLCPQQEHFSFGFLTVWITTVSLPPLLWTPLFLMALTRSSKAAWMLVPSSALVSLKSMRWVAARSYQHIRMGDKKVLMKQWWNTLMAKGLGIMVQLWGECKSSWPSQLK